MSSASRDTTSSFDFTLDKLNHRLKTQTFSAEAIMADASRLQDFSITVPDLLAAFPIKIWVSTAFLGAVLCSIPFLVRIPLTLGMFSIVLVNLGFFIWVCS